MMKFQAILVLFLPLFLLSSTDEGAKRSYAEQFQKAFELQHSGYTTKAYFTFKDAFQAGQKNGESIIKLKILEALFIWYRKFGYSCGLLPQASRCTDEYIGHKDQNETVYGSNLDPKQQRYMRDFLCGVGQFISGILCVTTGSAPVARFGLTLLFSGGKYMYDAVSSMMQDSKEKELRLKELKIIEQKGEATFK